MQSNRAEVLAQLPRSGAPPAFASYEDWEAFVDYFVRLGIGADYTRFWWDIRPHPKFGTLEIRMPDQPTSLAVDGRDHGDPAGALPSGPRPPAAARTTRQRAASTSRTAGQRRASA